MYVTSIKWAIILSVLLEEQNKLAKIAPSLPIKLNEDIEINPASGFIQPKKEAVVQVCYSIFSFRLFASYQKVNYANYFYLFNILN